MRKIYEQAGITNLPEKIGVSMGPPERKLPSRNPCCWCDANRTLPMSCLGKGGTWGFKKTTFTCTLQGMITYPTERGKVISSSKGDDRPVVYVNGINHYPYCCTKSDAPISHSCRIVFKPPQLLNHRYQYETLNNYMLTVWCKSTTLRYHVLSMAFGSESSL